MNIFISKPYCFRVWKCLKHRNGCKGRVKTKLNKRSPKIMHSHSPNCKPRPFYQQKKQFHEDLMHACEQPGNRSTYDTYWDLAKKYS